ncbi:hypothetical protein ACPUYX_01635 [Desulfosporosinus sp. SYSU MS00001]|uniref:hypothetical protein n=1 Tax=Desulfosporosinus sp. SYSU MS00001 TaxID=3416284 RepID=UPI003CF13639
MPKVIIYIQALSAEKTLARAVDSILSRITKTGFAICEIMARSTVLGLSIPV